MTKVRERSRWRSREKHDVLLLTVQPVCCLRGLGGAWGVGRARRVLQQVGLFVGVTRILKMLLTIALRVGGGREGPEAVADDGAGRS